MKLIRSWPLQIPRNRTGYVEDDAPRMVMQMHDYRRGGLADIDNDLLLLEWDIAVAKEDLQQFADLARKNPDDVLVAPYRLYGDRYPNLQEPMIWAHRHWAGEPKGMAGTEGAHPVATGDPTCNLFGLGMIYLPLELVRAFFADDFSNHVGDVEFSQWHYWNVAKDVPIAWDVRPVHLNFIVPSEL